jgi:sugar fermentation stimulation protein A
MEFTKSLIKGKLIKRYKRFFVDVKLDNEIIVAHCPNTGSMKGLLDEGNEVFVSKNDNPKRKLRYTLEIIKAKKKLVGINTHFANKIALHGLTNNLVKEVSNNDNIKPEVFFNKETRFDFLLEKNKQKIFVEVKNVTLFREEKVAEFPDSITSRGTKHLNELIKAKKEGYESYMLYLIQREDCDAFKIAQNIDEEYKFAFDEALKNKVNILCYDCKISNKEIKINKQITYDQRL